MKNPIVRSIFDIWFQSETPSEVLLGIIREKTIYKNVKKTPMLQIPEEIRLVDKNLKHQALYEIFPDRNKKPYKVVLGHNSLGLALNGDYRGWNESFFPEIQDIFQQVFQTDIITKITRCGLRYINFFPNENIFKKGKISIKINKEEIKNPNEKVLLNIKKQIDDKINMTLIVNNEITFNDKTGSVIDIASYSNNEEYLNSNQNKLFDLADEFHKNNKKYFKKVIDDELIEKLDI